MDRANTTLCIGCGFFSSQQFGRCLWNMECTPTTSNVRIMHRISVENTFCIHIRTQTHARMHDGTPVHVHLFFYFFERLVLLEHRRKLSSSGKNEIYDSILTMCLYLSPVRSRSSSHAAILSFCSLFCFFFLFCLIATYCIALASPSPLYHITFLSLKISQVAKLH